MLPGTHDPRCYPTNGRDPLASVGSRAGRCQGCLEAGSTLRVLAIVNAVPFREAMHQDAASKQASEAQELSCLTACRVYAKSSRSGGELVVSSGAALDERVQGGIAVLAVQAVAPPQRLRTGRHSEDCHGQCREQPRSCRCEGVTCNLPMLIMCVDYVCCETVRDLQLRVSDQIPSL